MANVLNSIIWILILIWIAWPVAGFCAMIYIFASPFLVCCTGCGPLIELLEKGLHWPKKVGEHILKGDAVC